MKQLPALFLIIFVFLLGKSNAQTVKTYDADWKKVEDLVQKKNLPKSALEEVKKIYAKAKSEKQEAQVIKALVYMVSLQQENREEGSKQAIAEIEKEIAGAKEPAASLLKALVADLYWQYFQQHRWQLYDRTNTTGFNKNDIATWTIEDFHRKISELYLQSLQQQALLKNTALEPFDAIIIKGNARHLRPTLYDLLAHKALDYFRNDERDLKKPAYAFEINQEEAFAPAAGFAAHTFTTNDSLSLKHKALQIYGELIRFHLKDAKPDALIDADIQRIQFVYENAVLEHKDSLYKKALETLFQKYRQHPVAAQAGYLLAAHYEMLANRFAQTKDSTYRMSRVASRKLLEAIVNDSARLKPSEGWANSYNLLKEITKPQFSFQVEKVNLPAMPFRALLQFRNVSTINFRLIKADETLKSSFENTYEEKFWNRLVSAPSVRSWQQAVPATNDLQQHTVEIKVDGLPTGEYILLASSDKNFNQKNNPIGARLFYVSNISYIGQAEQYFVLHRETGQPLANAAVTVFARSYDYKNSRYGKVKKGSYTTDKNGYFQMRKPDVQSGNGYYLDITHGGERLFLDDLIYNHYYYNQREENNGKAVFLFTDRSIYRPGQTVYFKGLVLERKGKQSGIIAGYKKKVYLQDANGENIDSIALTTNIFGSFNGTFVLPQGSLNGSFRLFTEEGERQYDASISVEEYKRPKFYVAFEKLKESYKVGDSVAVTGSAKAYAGNTISNANVVYRIVRQARFPYPWLFKSWWPRTEPMEITHGTATTDANGQFTLRFKAIPDLSIDKKTDPVFDYTLYADVTDINGETRSSEYQLSAGYKSLLLQVKLDERMPLDSLKNISIRTENMAGIFQPATVQVTVSRLVAEQRLIRARYWEQPDQFVMSRDEFIKLFPNDEYAGERDFKNWPKGDVVFSEQKTTDSSAQFALNRWQKAAGFYQIEISTKDKDGQEVKDIRYVELFDAKSNSLARPEYLWAKGPAGAIEPGEKTTVQIGSSASNIFLVQQVDKESERDKPANAFSFTSLSAQKKTFTFTATEEDRGGYGITYFFVKDNRFYQFSDAVPVPWSNKELTIEYGSFRDKTLPGSEEKWKVKISGYKGEKVAAEMLASMYDASLDQFRGHSWEKPDVWNTYRSPLAWDDDRNFSSVASEQKWIQSQDQKWFEKIYDRLLFESHDRIRYFLAGRVSGVATREVVLEQASNAAPAPSSKLDDSAADTTSMAPKIEAQTDTEIKYKVEREAPIPPAIQPRKNFNETAFFFPDLKTDEEGTIEFSFTVPEALTQWKLQTLAHTKDLAFGLSHKEIITQKELMVQPNMPRFLREGDQLELNTKIVNLSGKELTGQAELQLFDAATNQAVDGLFQNAIPNQYFTVAAGGSEVLKFPVEIPHGFNKALVWRIVAKAGNFSDGEEAALPLLTNKMLVTETLPLPMKGSGTKTFTFEKLVTSNSPTLQHHALTVEYTSNPAWYVVQALPYLMEFPYECSEQTWNRYYANAVASKIVNAAPRIRQVLEQWRGKDTAALLSNLQKNQELKSVLLEETPWVLQAKTEAEGKKNIALLFDMIRMSRELKNNLQQLRQMQSENGGFVWFKGGPDDRFITQYILAGIGHLRKLNAIAADQQSEVDAIVQAALPYLDKKIKEDYDRLVKSKAKPEQQQVGYTEIHYLYMRSFFPNKPVSSQAQTAVNYFRKQAKQFWMKGNKYMQGMTALALNRNGDAVTPKAILASLKETSVTHEEMGMYWKDNSFGRSSFWWQAPVETQALLIETFTEVGKDVATVNELKTWLIKNKQTNNWRTTKATADACYALLLQGTDWLAAEPSVSIQLGTVTLSSNGQNAEAGTGYFKNTIEGRIINPQMGNIKVTVSGKEPLAGPQSKGLQPSWGAVYWQYFEDMDKVTMAATPLQLTKKLFVEKNSDRGPVLHPVEEGAVLRAGDKIKVRIELRADRDMEYVHMKDMRASALEPVNVLSGYKWQGALGYYETTKDASTNFFFNYLRKGTYVFEYPLFVTHTGNFSNGITTIQCMYAPEFTAHSEGIKIRVE